MRRKKREGARCIRTLDTSSFVVFKDYKVENVGLEDGRYVVKVRAQPGTTLRK